MSLSIVGSTPFDKTIGGRILLYITLEVELGYVFGGMKTRVFPDLSLPRHGRLSLPLHGSHGQHGTLRKKTEKSVRSAKLGLSLPKYPCTKEPDTKTFRKAMERILLLG